MWNMRLFIGAQIEIEYTEFIFSWNEIISVFTLDACYTRKSLLTHVRIQNCRSIFTDCDDGIVNEHYSKGH
jgi:hypothetical protein